MGRVRSGVPGSLVGDPIADARRTMNTPSSAHLQAGLTVSQISIVWTVTVCAAAVVTGVIDGSLVLIAFGLTGLLDGAGSFVLSLHFRHALAHNAISSARERIALRVVSIGLIVIGGSTAIESVRRLIVNEAGHGSSIGVGIAGASAVVLAALAVAKHRIAQKLASNALRADGWLSATGAALALIAVMGAALSSGSAPAWIDPAAALSVACVAVLVGVIELRREEEAIAEPASSHSLVSDWDPRKGGTMTHGAIEWIEFHCEEGGSEKLGRFYEQVFGWKVQVDPSMPDYAMYNDTSGNVSGGFTSSIPKGEGATKVYITVDSADAALDAVGKAGGKTTQERTLISEEIGYWATFTDPSGNAVGLFEKKQ